jgi:hypothetical protein
VPCCCATTTQNADLALLERTRQGHALTTHHVTVPIPVPAPVTSQEKQGRGMKQVLSPLSPTPLPVANCRRRQRRCLYGQPRHRRLHRQRGIGRGVTRVRDRMMMCPKRDDPYAGVDGVSQGQGHGNDFGQESPTPAKDGVVETSQMAAYRALLPTRRV